MHLAQIIVLAVSATAVSIATLVSAASARLNRWQANVARQDARYEEKIALLQAIEEAFREQTQLTADFRADQDDPRLSTRVDVFQDQLASSIEAAVEAGAQLPDCQHFVRNHNIFEITSPVGRNARIEVAGEIVRLRHERDESRPPFPTPAWWDPTRWFGSE